VAPHGSKRRLNAPALSAHATPRASHCTATPGAESASNARTILLSAHSFSAIARPLLAP
jgi:hypothetical protein